MNVITLYLYTCERGGSRLQIGFDVQHGSGAGPMLQNNNKKKPLKCICKFNKFHGFSQTVQQYRYIIASLCMVKIKIKIIEKCD